LLAPVREAGARPRYDADDVYRVAVILRAKEAGLSLDAVRDMVAAVDPATRTVILRSHRAELAERIAATQAAVELVDAALDCEHEDFTRCPHFRSMVADRISPNPTPHARV
jgi:MerR family transcriptional regulator, copper efflux regulator